MAINVAVIGAGSAGLAAARQLKADPRFKFQIFEQTGSVGGTWVYDEKTGSDEYGVRIHTSMYKNLRTNLPKEVMGFPNYPIQKPSDKSYIPAADILRYLNEFADSVGAQHHIKFHHVVERVTPKNSGWEVTVLDAKSQLTQTLDFDAVMVCSGHYTFPNVPQIKGAETFRGKILHSHEYKRPEYFKGCTVVVIGAGPSGLDIALEIIPYAKHVYLSHHWPDPINTVFPENFSHKPDILSIAADEVIFKDGSSAKANMILYCTGFLYSYPFLTEECGIKVKENYVHPLYKHFVSIENPTLALIGLPYYICANTMFDIQTRCFLKTLNGTFKLPSKDEMLADEKRDFDERRKNGYSLKKIHMMGPLQMDYFDDLANTFGVEPVPHVLTKMHNHSSDRFLEDLVHFRNDRYEILDAENFKWAK